MSTTTRPDPTTAQGALDLAIFALNTLAHPDASSAEDFAHLDENTDKAIEKLAGLRDALPELLEVLGDPWTAYDVGPRFTCTEATRLAEFLLAADTEVGERFLRGHGSQDEPGDQHYVAEVDEA